MVAYPADFRDDLTDYDFGSELDYFALTSGDRVTAYGATWPDDSLRPDRIAQSIVEEKPIRQGARSATELMARIKP